MSEENTPSPDNEKSERSTDGIEITPDIIFLSPEKEEKLNRRVLYRRWYEQKRKGHKSS